MPKTFNSTNKQYLKKKKKKCKYFSLDILRYYEMAKGVVHMQMIGMYWLEKTNGEAAKGPLMR